MPKAASAKSRSKAVVTRNAQFSVISLADLVEDPLQVRVHNPRNVGTIEESLKRVGAVRSIAIDENLRVLAGNATVAAAMAAGFEHVLIVPTDGKTLVATQRSNMSEADKFDAAVADNRAAELATGWDAPKLLAGMQQFEILPDRYFYQGELPEFAPAEKLTDVLGPTGSTNRDVEDQLRKILDEGDQVVANLGDDTGGDSIAEAWLRQNGRLVLAELRGRLKTRRGANDLDERAS